MKKTRAHYLLLFRSNTSIHHTSIHPYISTSIHHQINTSEHEPDVAVLRTMRVCTSSGEPGALSPAEDAMLYHLWQRHIHGHLPLTSDTVQKLVHLVHDIWHGSISSKELEDVARHCKAYPEGQALSVLALLTGLPLHRCVSRYRGTKLNISRARADSLSTIRLDEALSIPLHLGGYIHVLGWGGKKSKS